MALIEMTLEVQKYIPGPPSGPQALWNVATRNDDITVKSWNDIWLKQIKENSEYFKFSEHSAMLEYHKCRYQPVIVAGSGPSLKKNWSYLKGTGDSKNLGRKDIKIISCLHNFGFFEDRDVMTKDDFYITLDSGEITLGEVTEGGTEHDKDWYWNRTADRTLFAFVGAYPELLKRWKGPIRWFITPFGTPDFGAQVAKCCDLGVIPALNVGGCVLGGAWYCAEAILGCSTPIFIGADFAFGYDRKFHAWDSQYDSKFAGVMPWTDIFGNRVWTWASYFGFKNWFDYQACGGQGGNSQIWVNATEGGILGAYPEGNIQQITQLDLRTALQMFNRSHLTPDLVDKSKDGIIHLLT